MTGAHAVVYHATAIEPAFVAYFLQTNEFNSKKAMIVDGVKVIEMKVAQLSKIRIPVPPIEVQREIVRILDSFQELDDALTAEIEAREGQLDCLRAEVYADETCPMIALGSVGTFERGKRFTRAQMGGSGTPCIHYGDIYTRGLVQAAVSIAIPERGNRVGERRTSRGRSAPRRSARRFRREALSPKRCLDSVRPR